MTHKNATLNRLANEKSPYLLQHASNPVDWWPWRDDAFEEARREDKMVFLSIGYSTCHWCHVMAHESFEDEEVAQWLREGYVAIKLDREERPDIDKVYMDACMAMNLSGGWPLTVLATSEGRPFFAGTYLTKPQLMSLLRRATKLWREDRAAVEASGARLAEHLAREENPGERAPDRALIARAVDGLKRSFDAKDGGFGAPPRFPMPQNLLLLMEQAPDDAEALPMAERQLAMMYRGGLFDHVGGGFARYATDRRWLIPHFEKMLYDNALLTYAYAEAYALTGRKVYRVAAERTADYVLRELTSEGGGFFSAQDADSEGGEGAFYLFERAELERVAGPELADWYGATEAGNFEGRNILNLLGNEGWEGDDAALAPARAALYAYRKDRMALGTDRKVLTAWNALMIAALSRAARALNAPRYRDAALKAWDFIRAHMQDADGRLFIRWADGQAAGDGLLDDYAFLAWGLIELYRAALDPSLLIAAEALARILVERFRDAENGGFFLNAADAGLIHRPKEFYDGAMPSGNAVAALAMLELGRYTAQPRWREAAERQLRTLCAAARSHPGACAFALLVAARHLTPSRELVCACADEDAARVVRERLSASGDRALYVLVKTPGNAQALDRLAPFTADYPLPAAGARLYPCQRGACGQPVDAFEQLPPGFA
ncbi:thioredoxin domain-containing protein [Bacillota bacterium Meth-B3]